MSMLLGDLTFSVELIAVGVGAALMIWGMRNEGKGVLLARCAGYFVGILATASLLTTSYMSFKVHQMQSKTKPPMVRSR